MASVINVVARPREHPGRANNTGETVFYLVEFDTTGFTLWQARNATTYTPPGGSLTAGVPADGAALTVGSNLVVTYKEATPKQESPRVVLVEVQYSVPVSGFSIFQPEGETVWNISIECEGISFVESVNMCPADSADPYLPIVNSRGKGFDPGPVKEYYDEIVTVSYTTTSGNLASWDSEIPPARGKINTDVVTLTFEGITRTFAARTLKLGNARYGVTVGFNSSGELEKQFRVQIPLLYRYDTWVRKIVDMDIDGTGKPIYLDGLAGLPLPDGDDAVLLEFPIEGEIAFSTFLSGIGV